MRFYEFSESVLGQSSDELQKQLQTVQRQINNKSHDWQKDPGGDYTVSQGRVPGKSYDKLDVYKRITNRLPHPGYQELDDEPDDDIASLANQSKKNSPKKLNNEVNLAHFKPEDQKQIAELLDRFSEEAARRGVISLRSQDPTKGNAGLRVYTNNGHFSLNFQKRDGAKKGSFWSPKLGVEKCDILRSALEPTGLVVNGSKELHVYPSNPGDFDSLFQEFWQCYDLFDSLGPEFKQSTRQTASSKFQNKQTDFEYFRDLATNIYDAVKDNAKYRMPRGGGNGAYDANDKVIRQGISKAGYDQLRSGKDPYREHAVPCDEINRIGIDIVNSHQPLRSSEKDDVLTELADMIKKLLIVVWISDAEAKKLDSNPPEGLGLKTTMPDGWNWETDSALERLNVAGIKVRSLKSAKTITEN